MHFIIKLNFNEIFNFLSQFFPFQTAIVLIHLIISLIISNKK